MTDLINGGTSDGYHTFDELYEHRNLLFLAFLRYYKDRSVCVWRSLKHFDGSTMDGYFIAGTMIPCGADGLEDAQISYHLPDCLWDLCDFLETSEKAPHQWDGHTSNEVLKRLTAMLRQ